MANQKVTDLAAYSSVKTTDTYHVVDTTDTSQDPAGSSYKVTWATIKAAILAFFSGGTGITFSGGVISSDPTATQTLTNKTLTSPTINTPTITSPALTVGSDATGDTYYRGAGGFTRLPIGSTNNVLTVNSGLPAWVAPTASQYNNYLADTGAANAYAITPSPSISSYTTGQVFVFKAANANTTTSTLNVNALGAKTINKNNVTALAANDILAGQIVEVAYDGTNFQMLSPVATSSIYTNGNTSKNSADASTTQTIAHGLGRIPKYVRLNAFGLVNGVSLVATSTYNGTTQSSVSIQSSGSSTLTMVTAFSINANNTGADSQTGVVTFDATNISIVWTKSGLPTGTFDILWEAFA